MSSNTKPTMHIRQPAPPSLEAIEKPVVVGREMALIYCPTAKTGAIYYIDSGLWHTFHPMETFGDFKRFLVNSFPEALVQKH